MLRAQAFYINLYMIWLWLRSGRPSPVGGGVHYENPWEPDDVGGTVGKLSRAPNLVTEK
jgi:hypothetical protein